MATDAIRRGHRGRRLSTFSSQISLDGTEDDTGSHDKGVDAPENEKHSPHKTRLNMYVSLRASPPLPGTRVGGREKRCHNCCFRRSRLVEAALASPFACATMASSSLASDSLDCSGLARYRAGNNQAEPLARSSIHTWFFDKNRCPYSRGEVS